MRLKDKVAIVTSAPAVGKESHEPMREGAARRDCRPEPNGGRCGRRTRRSAQGPRRGHGRKEQQVEAGSRAPLEQFGKIDVLVSNPVSRSLLAGRIQFATGKTLAIHLDGAFLDTCRASAHVQARRSIAIWSVHSKETSVKRLMLGQAGPRRSCQSGRRRRQARRARERHCPACGPLVDKQIRSRPRLGISGADVIKKVMLKDTVDGNYRRDVAETAPFFAGFESNALTGQSLVVSHGWCDDKPKYYLNFNYMW
jgi:3-hydroxybutyrate dehydrogenase